MTTTYVDAAQTAVQDVWGSLSQPTSAGSDYIGSAVKSPDVAPSRRTGSASMNSSEILAAARGIQVVLHGALDEKNTRSRILDILQRLYTERRPASPISLLIPHTRLIPSPNGGLIIETGDSETIHESTVDRDLPNTPPPRRPDHSQTADDVRSLTGLPTAKLASSLGVSREQYQRWLRGSAISTIRHGQLVYLHTISADLTRKLGSKQGKVWWRTPGADGVKPEDLLTERRLDLVHELVALVPDPQPISDGVLQGLRIQSSVEDLDESEDLDDEETWSPYTESKSDE